MGLYESMQPVSQRIHSPVQVQESPIGPANEADRASIDGQTENASSTLRLQGLGVRCLNKGCRLPFHPSERPPLEGMDNLTPLAAAYIIHPERLTVDHCDCHRPFTPPILRRPRLPVVEIRPARHRFARLTAREEGFALLQPGQPIGTCRRWQALDARGLSFRGHQVVAVQQ